MILPLRTPKTCLRRSDLRIGTFPSDTCTVGNSSPAVSQWAGRPRPYDNRQLHLRWLG